jgi:hypothetical protein
VAPEVEAFQSAAEFTPDQEIAVDPGKGMVLIVE